MKKIPTLPTAHHIFLDVNLTALSYNATVLTQYQNILQNGLKESLVVDFVLIRKILTVGQFVWFLIYFCSFCCFVIIRNENELKRVCSRKKQT